MSPCAPRKCRWKGVEKGAVTIDTCCLGINVLLIWSSIVWVRYLPPIVLFVCFLAVSGIAGPAALGSCLSGYGSSRILLFLFLYLFILFNTLKSLNMFLDRGITFYSISQKKCFNHFLLWCIIYSEKFPWYIHNKILNLLPLDPLVIIVQERKGKKQRVLHFGVKIDIWESEQRGIIIWRVY